MTSNLNFFCQKKSNVNFYPLPSTQYILLKKRKYKYKRELEQNPQKEKETTKTEKQSKKNCNKENHSYPEQSSIPQVVE